MAAAFFAAREREAAERLAAALIACCDRAVLDVRGAVNLLPFVSRIAKSVSVDDGSGSERIGKLTELLPSFYSHISVCDHSLRA